MIRLENYIKQIRGISYKPEDISEIPLHDYLPILKANNIQDNGLDTSNLIYIHKSKIKKEQFIRKGDLLLAASSGSKEVVGKNVHFTSDFEGSFGAFCKIVRPSTGINPEFLRHFFKTPQFRNHIRNRLRGANINNLRDEDINSLLVPDISIQNQIHFSLILDRISSLISKRKESIRLLDEFLKSTFLAMFGDPVRNEKNWELSKLGDVLKIKHGFAFSSENFATEGEYVLLTPGNYYEEGGYRDRGEKQKYFVGEFPKDYLLNKGDLLIAMTEQAAGLLGSAIIIPESGKFLHNQRLGLVQFDLDKCNTHFLFSLFNFNSIRVWIHTKATGIKVRHTSPGRIQEIYVGIPPLEIQIEFAKIVEKNEAIKARCQQSLQELENLYSSLSHKAFKGEMGKSKLIHPN